MGVGVELLVVEWPRVEAAAPDARYELLTDAAFGEAYSDDLFEHGWSWPKTPGENWYGRYAFKGTLGSYKPHFWAGHRWDHLREFVAPETRAPLDRFLDALVWDGLEYTESAGTGLPERDPAWDADLLLWRPPEDPPVIAEWWRQAAPRLESLREPFDQHAAAPGGWISTFEEFTRLLSDWGEVALEAERRGWGLVGLRC
ncbi:hypothetical protein [Streptomyces spectabilis]|uniref:Uncharacterized protein n=1 Tax=Streptomyces spectabilis TaxID=68270 RepID=A0A516R0K8_STRST|nr:hypothetical protein [Streptomyces spectabilis]QDQ09195.1 hypothetical protein FH965_00270 [Streptomyces spectabilis]